MQIAEQYKLLDSLIRKDTSFAIYKKPNDDTLYFLLDTTNKHTKTLKSYTQLERQEGFVIAPFSISKGNPLVLICPNLKLEGETEILNYLNSIEPSYSAGNGITNNISAMNKDSLTKYQLAFDLFKTQLNEKIFDKIVLSKPSWHTRKENFSAGLSFKQAVDKYANNYVYLCHTAQTGTWLGITPEMLLAGNSNDWNTVALAGTKPLAKKKQEWDSKNILEQAIVMDFVEQQLQSLGLKYTETMPKTIQAGELMHLRSDFDFELKDEQQITKLISMLHPTPAVCGFPKQDCFNYILANEGYDRRYYSGFVGYYNPSENTSLYVNLRCMEINKNDLTLYAGGGLLTDSSLDSEIQEIENKLRTSLSIIYD